MITIQEIIQQAKLYLPRLDEVRMLRAYDFANTAHKDQKRFSGEPYITHPLEIAKILLDFHADENTLVAALLHDVSEDTEKSLKNIEANFGIHVHDLCWGMEKLSKVRSKLNDSQMENLRKLFLAMAKDFRVVLLKLCDRLHNMRTLEFVRPEKQTRIAQETLNVYAPIAARLGIYRLKSQLEDLCFAHLHPIEYKDIQKQLAKTSKWREKYIDTAKKILSETLAKEGIHSSADGRVKSVYSIYRKMKKKNKTSVDEIFDVFAMRILLPDIYKYDKEYTGHLYTALGVLHNNFTPLANRFKDYVAVPKVNGYRSLHTTVVGLGPEEYGQPTEIQIRTNSMHQAAELGIAAHWLYEEDVNIPLDAAVARNADFFMKKHRDWISGLHKIETETESNQELLDNLKIDIFQDRIFVLTPRGDVKDLPAGATPVDFAYAVHTEVGNHCMGAKVNGAITPLNYELKSGEVVEIITRKNAQPSRHWLTFVKTSYARTRIRAWFNNFDESKNLREGKNLLNAKLKQLGKLPLDENLSLLKTYGGANLSRKEREDLLVEIGRGAVLPSVAIRKIFSMEELLERRPAKLERPPATEQGSDDLKLYIGGEENVPHHFVKCCNATSSDDLVGYITRGRGISVHKKSCPVIRNSEPNRFVLVRNKGTAGRVRYAVRIRIDVNDRIGLMRDIANVIFVNSVNIIDVVHEEAVNGRISIDFTLEIEDLDQLERILYSLEKIPSVRRAIKVN